MTQPTKPDGLLPPPLCGTAPDCAPLTCQPTKPDPPNPPVQGRKLDMGGGSLITLQGWLGSWRAWLGSY